MNEYLFNLIFQEIKMEEKFIPFNEYSLQINRFPSKSWVENCRFEISEDFCRNLIEKQNKIEKRLNEWINFYNLENFILNNFKWKRFTSVHPKYYEFREIESPEDPNEIKIEKVEIPTTKGKFLEEQIHQGLKQYLKNSKIEYCAKTPHSGDFIVTLPKSRPIMIDSKNYSLTNKVPSSEIKFFNDLKEQKIKYGILVSTSTFATTKNKVDYIQKEDMHVIVINNYENAIEIVFACNIIHTFENIDIKRATMVINNSCNLLEAGLKRCKRIKNYLDKEMKLLSDELADSYSKLFEFTNTI